MQPSLQQLAQAVSDAHLPAASALELQPLFADLVARLPLAEADWALCLGRAWPAGMERPAEVTGRILARFACF